MPGERLVSFENSLMRPRLLIVKPSGEEYTLLPDDKIDFFPIDDELVSLEPPRVVVEDMYIELWLNVEFQAEIDKRPIASGFQRYITDRTSVQLEFWLPVSPKTAHYMWTKQELLSEILGEPVLHDTKKIKYKSTYIAYNGKVEWTPILSHPYQSQYFLLRTADFPPNEINSHVEITQADKDNGTQILIQHRYLPSCPDKNWLEFWQKLFVEPIQKYFLAKEGEFD